MGHHYLPQYYLRGFVIDNDLLWAYEKGTGQKHFTQVKGIANITNLYSPKVEEFLANNIEAPANIVLEKIRDRDKITEDNKTTFSKYMAVMWKRVPRLKERLREMAPSLAEKISDDVNRDLDRIAFQQPEKVPLIKKRRREIKVILDRYSKHPPDTIWLENIPPQTTPRALAAIKAMKWTFLTFDEYPAFLTCDNPIFYFTQMGLKRPESEITFPVSSNITLWATWRDDLPEGYVKTTKQVVREINRRTAHNSGRYIFHGQDESWIESFVKKGRWKLHRLW